MQIADETTTYDNSYDPSAHSQDSNALAFAKLINQYRQGDSPAAWVYTEFEQQLLRNVEQMRQNIEYWAGYARTLERERIALTGRLIRWMTIATVAIVVVFVIFAALAITLVKGGL